MTTCIHFQFDIIMSNWWRFKLDWLINTKVNICFPPSIGYVKFKFEHCTSCARLTWSVQHHDNCLLRVRTHKHKGSSFDRAGSRRNIVILKIYGNGYCSLITTVFVLVPLYSYGFFSHRPEISSETDRNWPWSLPVFYFPCIWFYSMSVKCVYDIHIFQSITGFEY